jgi:RNA polymerase sigma factor (sigma-70 family)
VVAEFVGPNGPFLAADRDDLIQDGLIQWWRKRDSWRPDGGASRETYLRNIVRNRLRDLTRERQAEKRGGGEPPLSLDRPTRGAEAGMPAIGAQVTASDDPVLAANGALERERILQLLTPRQRQIAQARADSVPTTALARRLGLSRDTLYGELERIRATLRRAGYGPDGQADPTDRTSHP